MTAWLSITKLLAQLQDLRKGLLGSSSDLCSRENQTVGATASTKLGSSESV